MGATPTIGAGFGFGEQLLQGPAPGMIAPREVGTPKEEQEENQLGPNNERLEELEPDVANALKRLVEDLGKEDYAARVEEVKRIRQAREFWRGLQYIFWSDRDLRWHLPGEHRLTEDTDDDELPPYDYVTNIFQAYGLAIISVLSQDIPRTRLWPQSAQQEEDVATAKGGTEVIQLVERNNHIGSMMIDEAFYLWCDGKIGGYVRYVVDGQRFGYHDEDEAEPAMAKIGEDYHLCPDCRQQVDASKAQDMWNICPTCGTELNEESLVEAPTVEVPRITQKAKMPNGQEVLTIVGGLELKTPMWANDQHDFPYLKWDTEGHKARLKAAYPHVAEKIGQSGGSGSSEVFERTARVSVTQGTSELREGTNYQDNLVTFERAWLRPWVFWLVEDKKVRSRLQELFSNGAYVAIAGGTYCESRNESMDDHWRVMHAIPGDGQNRPALGTSLISVQERLNTEENLTVETFEHVIPTTFADPEVVDFDALRDTPARPGDTVPAKQVNPGQPLGNSFFETAAANIPSDMMRHKAELRGELAQFLSAAFPALFGGAAKGAGGDTASGYAMQRDQALGRIGLTWRRMKYFHADLMLLAVDTFRKNRPDDVEVPIFGEGEEFESNWIRLADLKGNIFAYPESDEQYPALWQQQRAVLLELMGSQDPMVQAVLGDPDNLNLIKRLVGLQDLVIPDESSRTKQYQEIDQLLNERPTIDMFGPGQAQPMPSIQPDGFGDNHAVELEVVRRWMNSPRGQKAKVQNPEGFANVRAHGMLHEQIMQQQAILNPAPGEGAGAEVAESG